MKIITYAYLIFICFIMLLGIITYLNKDNIIKYSNEHKFKSSEIFVDEINLETKTLLMIKNLNHDIRYYDELGKVYMKDLKDEKTLYICTREQWDKDINKILFKN